MALQVTGGVAGGAVGAAALGAALFGLTYATSERESYAPLYAGALGVFIGGLVGSVMTVKLVGDERDATGGWTGTSLGLLGGALLAGLAAEATDAVKLRVPAPVKIGLGVLALFGGATLGYQITSDGSDTASSSFMLALPVATF